MEPIYFHRASHYLSQWHPSPFTSPTHPSITFHTAEQYMMYRKALLFRDPATAAAILTTTKPGAQKKLGRQVKGFDERVWEREREGIVEEGSWCKFMFPVNRGEEGKEEGGGGLSLKERLVSTGERELVEASPSDRIWGIGFAEDRAEANRRDWGQNLLGKALMRVRERIVKEGKEKEEKEEGDGEEKQEKNETEDQKEKEEEEKEKTTEKEKEKTKEKGKGREKVKGKEKGKG